MGREGRDRRRDAVDCGEWLAAGEAWIVFSCDFGVYDMIKTTASYTLAVR